MIIFRILCCISITAVLFIPAVSMAVEQKFPSEIRVITPTTATSDCIGDPKTPVCALETWLACVYLEDDSLCEMVMERPIREKKGPRSVKYRIESVCYFRWRDPENASPNTKLSKDLYAELVYRIYIVKGNDKFEDVYHNIKIMTSQSWKTVLHAMDTIMYHELGRKPNMPLDECKPELPPSG